MEGGGPAVGIDPGSAQSGRPKATRAAEATLGAPAKPQWLRPADAYYRGKPATALILLKMTRFQHLPIPGHFSTLAARKIPLPSGAWL
jgi:hypothetical protein